MKPHPIRLLILCLFPLLPTGAHAQGFSACELKCEYLENPLAVNTLTPKFSWKAASERRGFVQSAYEIRVADTREELAARHACLWDSGKVRSGQSLHIPYAGAALFPGEFYYWSVRIYDATGKASAWSEPARFGIGLLGEKDWEGAQWIALELMPEKERLVPGAANNATLRERLGGRNPGRNKLPQFRREIDVRKPLSQAVAYISGLGHFDFFLNGRKVGDHLFDPAATDYDKLVNYVPFEVTPLLRQGRNALGVMLGNGFISIPRERYYKGLASYMYPKMILKLTLEYADGSRETVVSDTSWRTTESPVTYSSVYGGEDYDATRLREGWMEPGYDDSAWQRALPAPLGEGTVLQAQTAYPLRVMQRFRPVTRRLTRHGKWLYDLGQNFQGIVQLTVTGKKGQRVMIHATELYDEKADSVHRFGGYKDEVRFTYTIGSDDRPETWHPQFTNYGLRYVQVTGAVPAGEKNPGGLPVIGEIVGLHVRNSAPAAGSFRCSDELLNRINTLIEWGIKGNMGSFMTDCPHREKLPWIEQLHLMFGSLQSNFDLYKLYEKIADDMAAAQWENGLVPDVAPMYFLFGDGFVDSPEWGSSMILVPWKVYEYYGDPSLVERHYDSMKRYLEYLESKATDHILSHGLGDWCDIGPKRPGVSQHTSLAATATPVFYMDAVTMTRAAELLGRKQDAVRFRQLAEKIKRSYNAKFFHPDTKSYDRGSQAANAIALCAGLVAPDDERAVAENIAADIRARGNALTAGDVGYNFVLRALEAHGMSEVIYAMNSRYDIPGYGYQIARGATALPETWDARTDHSHNHLMLGHLQEWFYTQVGGIQRDPQSSAYKRFIVKPTVVGGITFARTSFESPYGTISTGWETTPGGFRMKVAVPPNTTAQIWIPAAPDDTVTESGIRADRASGVRHLFDAGGYKVYEAGGGTYRFAAGN